MSTPDQLRDRRLQNDIKSLESIRCQVIDWVACDESLNKFLITFKIRSIIGLENNTPLFSDSHIIEIHLPVNYPLVSPTATMARGYKPPFHPNFFTSGAICTQSNHWIPTESLAVFVIRIARMFQFDHVMTNPDNAANTSAAKWYRNNKEKGIFPTDTTLLPVWADNDDDDFVMI